MRITDWAAWWGVIIATFVLVCDMYKWKRSGTNNRCFFITQYAIIW